jgi:hypothetical protein
MLRLPAIHVLPIFLLLLLFAAPARGTMEYAEQTGKSCEVCHKEPAGGKDLTKEGEAFRNDLRLKGQYRPLTVPSKQSGSSSLLPPDDRHPLVPAPSSVSLILSPPMRRGDCQEQLTLGWVRSLSWPSLVFLSLARVPPGALFHTRFGLL